MKVAKLSYISDSNYTNISNFQLLEAVGLNISFSILFLFTLEKENMFS